MAIGGFAMKVDVGDGFGQQPGGNRRPLMDPVGVKLTRVVVNVDGVTGIEDARVAEVREAMAKVGIPIDVVFDRLPVPEVVEISLEVLDTPLQIERDLRAAIANAGLNIKS